MLPKHFVCKVILACHHDNGHLGMERILGLLQERFFWPTMADNVCIHICTCDRCTRFKQPQERFEMQPILVSYPLELVHLDFLTIGGNAEDNSNDNMLIVTDHFTKYSQAYVTQNRQLKQLFQPYGKLFWYTMDGLKRFSLIKENLLRIASLAELCKVAQIKKLHTSTYHPESNGQCEHFKNHFGQHAGGSYFLMFG